MVSDSPFGPFPDNFGKFLRPTHLADADHSFIRKQSKELTRGCKTVLKAATAIHTYVANLPTGFDKENLPASVILQKARGMCNTKTTLFIALARAAGIPCQVHAYKVHKYVHRNNMPGLVYFFTPSTTLFTYPVIYYKKKWMLLSEALTKKDNPTEGACPFDDATNRKQPLDSDMIAEDLGIHWNPDLIYNKYGINSKGWRALFYPLAQKLLNNYHTSSSKDSANS